MDPLNLPLNVITPQTTMIGTVNVIPPQTTMTLNHWIYDDPNQNVT